MKPYFMWCYLSHFLLLLSKRRNKNILDFFLFEVGFPRCKGLETFLIELVFRWYWFLVNVIHPRQLLLLASDKILACTGICESYSSPFPVLKSIVNTLINHSLNFPKVVIEESPVWKVNKFELPLSWTRNQSVCEC